MKNYYVSFLFTVLLSILPIENYACSAFLFKGKDYSIVGFNENWKSMPGMVIINPAGVEKHGLSWNQLVSDTIVDEQKTSWTSRYGSVSFNLLGIDMPCYGVNEKGLFIVELYLDKTFSIKGENKPSLFWGQWIQYQLDNFSTVDDVISNLNNSPIIDWWPTFPGSHFFLSDKTGNTAAIELIDGKYVIAHGDNMPIPILCNDQYAKELNVLNTYKAFGGTNTFDPSKSEWSERYIKAAHYLQQYDSNLEESPVDYSWYVLNNIGRGEWQLIYDVENNNLQFRTDIGTEVKTIDMSKIDFSKTTPKYLDINIQTSGNISDNFMPLTVSINDEYVSKGFPIGYENAEFGKSKSYQSLLQNIHNYTKRIYKLDK